VVEREWPAAQQVLGTPGASEDLGFSRCSGFYMARGGISGLVWAMGRIET
jgi:hypothetical protein